MKSPEGLTTTPSSSPADEQSVGTSTESAESDSQITTDVIAGDSLGKDVNIGVTTAQTGTRASQNAIDHAKDVAGTVKDVKSVDASALVLASL